jgi:crotonobetainyl-CoA:carnitine CoA-transferase CaiB-like acyl-CoA transferase
MNLFPDPVGGYYGYAAIVTALHHREVTGEGQHIDLSMQESNATLIGDAIMQYLANGEVRPRLGNRHMTFAPHGIYPAAGDDRWVAIAAESEDQWRALVETAGRAEWARDPRFQTDADRKANEDALDAAISEWTAGRDRLEIARVLADAGVIAAPLLDGLEVGAFEAFRERGVVVDLDHPEAGSWPHIGVPYHFSKTPGLATRPSPLLGQHSEEVLAELLGVGPDEYAALVARGVTGSDPPD